MPQKRITVVGPVNADIMVIGNYRGDWRGSFEWEAPADITLILAGSSGYTLQDFRKLGARCSIFSCVGDDSIGTGLIHGMKEAGIDTDNLRICSGQKTAVAVYWLMHGNQKRPFAYQMSEFTPWPLEWSEETEERLLDADLLHCGGYLHYDRMFYGNTARLFERAKERGLVTSVDTQFPLTKQAKYPWLLNMQDLLPHIDVLITDENEARSLSGEEELDAAAKKLLHTNMKALIIKKGKGGSFVYSAQGRLFQEAVSVGETIDSIGAGDAYGAGFMTYYIEGRPLKECARFAAVVAGSSVTMAGGVAGMPTRQAAEEYIERLKSD